MENHYRSNLRDIYFNLFEVFDLNGKVLGRGPYGSLDEATVRQMLTEMDQLCANELAKSFAGGDRDPPQRDAQGRVTLPEVMNKALRVYYEGEWHKLSLPAELGGFGAPPSVGWASFELLTSANAALAFYMAQCTIARVIGQLGTEKQRRLYTIPMLDRHWGGAMVLTEADAGSDVGQIRCKATHVKDDVWKIEGVKRFITNGDYEGTENIVHLLLARPQGAEVGTKGLSMFIVPKFWLEDDGSLGARNGTYCSNLEKKMGLKGSVTCEMEYGQDQPCLGLLVGDVHDGLRQMFHVIEHARMAVGMKSMTELSLAYLHALEFAKMRIQGADLKVAHIKTSPRVPILQHPDVRRMLLTLRAHAEGMRALSMLAASTQDEVELLGGHRAEAARNAHRLNDLLLPLVKGYCSEKAYELLGMAVQCLGGSGYLQDYPIEQYLRDQKIDSLYEGTTHIQALDLIVRKLMKDGGATFGALLERVQEDVEDSLLPEDLRPIQELMARAVNDIQGLGGALMQKATESIYHVGLQGNRILFATAEFVIGWLWLRQAKVARQKLPNSSGKDRDFYLGKIQTAHFYCQNVLPGLTLARKLVEQSSLSIMDLPVDSF